MIRTQQVNYEHKIFLKLSLSAMHTVNYVDADEENLLAYQLTHRDRHIAWTLAHPTMSGFNTVHNTCVSIFIPIAPLKHETNNAGEHAMK
jgi:hypothetical protein